MGVKGPFPFLTRPAAEKRERDGRVGPRKWDVPTLGFAPKIMHVSDLTFDLKFPVFKLGSISIQNRSNPRPVWILACFERKAIHSKLIQIEPSLRAAAYQPGQAIKKKTGAAGAARWCHHPPLAGHFLPCFMSHERKRMKTYVASVRFNSFRGMLQVFQMDVAKVNWDVAYVAIVVHVCCKRLFPMFHVCFWRML
jgi:hypothetical protein